MGMKANRTMGRGAGETYKADRNKYCEIQTIWRMSVDLLHRGKGKTELEVCNIANLSLELNCPNTDTACIINMFLQIGNAAHRS
jgi:hypothetical protein